MFTRQPPHGRPLPLHVFLLPAIPVLALWSGNAREVTGLAPLWLAAGLGLGAVLLAGILVVVQRDVRRSALIAAGMVLLLATYGRVFSPSTDDRIGLTVTGAVVLAIVVLATRLGDPSLRRMTVVLNVVAVALILANGSLIAVNRPPGVADPPTRASAPADGLEPGRDVWYLVPDRHPSFATLLAMGIPVSDMTSEYEARGFDVMVDARANYRDTERSLAAAWSGDLLDEPPGPASEAEAVRLLRDPMLGRAFRDAGYEYLHLGSWFDATVSARSAHRVLTLEGTGEFYDAFEWGTILPALRSQLGFGLPGFAGPHVRHREHARHQLDVLEELASEPAAHRRFVLAHLLLPHPPYVFDEEGNPVPPDLGPEQAADGYADQLAYTHDRLLALVDQLQSWEEPPLILIMSDEGVHPHDVSTVRNGRLWQPDGDGELEVSRTSIFTALQDPTGQVRELPETATALTVTRSLLQDMLDVGDGRAVGTVLWPGDGQWEKVRASDLTDTVFPP